MVNELLSSTRTGMALAMALQTAFASAHDTSQALGQTISELSARHARLGQIMARAMAHPTRNLAELNRRYQQLGETLEQLRAKQEKLTASMARGEALKAARADLLNRAKETIGVGQSLAIPIVQSVRLAASFQDQVRNTAITGQLNPAEEARLANTLRQSALKWNQTQMEVARGVDVLASGGIHNARALEAYAPVMAKAATATRDSMDDLGGIAIGLRDTLGIGEDGFESALNMLLHASDRGRFKLPDMNKWLPALAPSFTALGVTGKEAIAEIGASLQIARKGASSNDEAAGNLGSFMQKITAPDTLKAFSQAGINLKKDMMALRVEGMTPMQSMLEIITRYMGKQGPDAMAQFRKALAIKDDKERETALRRMSEAYKLGELFQDAQAISFIRQAIGNQGEMKDIQQGAMAAGNAASGNGLLDQHFQKRMEGFNEQLKQFRIGLMDVSITIGNILLPPLTELLQAVNPIVISIGEWIKTHPGVVRWTVGLVGGLLAGKLAVIGLGYGLNLLMSPFNMISTAMHTLSAKFYLLKAQAQAGKFDPLLRMLGRVRSVISGFATRTMSMGFSGIGNTLMGGLRAALPWLGRAGMMLLRLSPIGLALSAVGLLVYKYWQPIKGFFVGLWQGLSSTAGPVIKTLIRSVLSFGMSMGRMLLSISGVGLIFRLLRAIGVPVFNVLIRGAQAVWTWFKNLLKPVDDVGGKAQNMGQRFGTAIGNIIKKVADLPVRFLKLGSQIIDGLTSGVKARFGEAVAAVGHLGNTIAEKFRSALGIKSPSRVFIGFGGDIARGAALGVRRSAALTGQAVAGMALATTVAWGKPQLAPPRADLASRMGNAPVAQRGPASASPAGMVIHFSPQITLKGGDPATMRGQVNQAMQLSFAEFERMMKRHAHEKGRTTYGRNA